VGGFTHGAYGFVGAAKKINILKGRELMSNDGLLLIYLFMDVNDYS